MFTLRLFVMGLVVLVPNQQDGSMAILLQHEGGHSPVLVWDPKDVVEADADDACTIKRKLALLESRRLGGFLLAQERLTLTGPSTDGLTLSGGTQSGLDFLPRLKFRWFHRFWGRVPKDHLTARDFSWVPNISALAGGVAINPDLLLHPEANGIAGLMKVRARGTVRVFSFASACGRVSSLTFKEQGSTRTPIRAFRQALADVVVLELPIEEGEVTITAVEFEGSQSPRSVTLRPKEGEQFLDVLIGNLSPLEPLVDAQTFTKEEVRGLISDKMFAQLEMGMPVELLNADCSGTTAEHFEHYYGALRPGANGKRLIPHVGRRHRMVEEVEPCEPPHIIRAVSGRSRIAPEGDIIAFSGETRPICTVVTANQ